MTDTKQPEALEIAKTLDALDMGGCAEFVRNQYSTLIGKEAMLQNKILLLVSRDARIAALEAENRALKEREEAISAGGVTGLRADHFRDAAQKVRFERAKGSTALAMLENLSDALWQCGDAVLVWANEGDLHMFGAAIAQEGGK